MKDKIFGFIKYFFALVFSITAIIAIFYFFDEFLNGYIVDWFDRNYVFYFEDMVPMISYNDLKVLAFVLVIIAVIIFITLASIAISISKRRTRKKLIEKTSKMIRTYMANETDVFSVFPKNFAPISAEMAEIKADITRKEQMLKEESARKNDLIAYLAHDLKTPLTSVIGYLSLMNEAEELSIEQRAKYVNITLEKAKRLEEMINSFFDIARYNLQQTVIEKESIDLQYMMIQMIEEFYPLLKSHGNTVDLKINEGITVSADANELARVFNNILKNAVAYSYSNTPISISAYCEEDNIHIVFANKGKTIPKQKLDSIFDKFFRLDSARSTNSGGAGLGLAIAREIITLHGGNISAYSENEITVFEVILPNS